MSDTERYASAASVSRGGKAAATASGDGGCCGSTVSSRNTTGAAIATSLSQYWKACTKVIDRMPPAATTTPTMTATASAPTQRGSPVVMPTVRAAPWSCGTM